MQKSALTVYDSTVYKVRRYDMEWNKNLKNNSDKNEVRHVTLTIFATLAPLTR